MHVVSFADARPSRWPRLPWRPTALPPLAPFARPFAALFYVPHPWFGAVLLAALALHPRFAAFALAAGALGTGFARLMGFPQAMIADGTLLYNVVLAGLAAAWITEGSAVAPHAMALLIVAVVMVALVLAAACWHLAPRLAGMPPLSLAFSVVFGSILLLFPIWAGVAVTQHPAPVPEPLWIGLYPLAFLRALGTVIFLPHALPGAMVAVALLVWSRTAFVCAVAGYCGGVATIEALSALYVPWAGLASAHTYLLAGLAIGGIYLVPGWRALGLAALAGALAACLACVQQHIWRGGGWAFLPLPYILTTWTMIAALRLRDGNARPFFAPNPAAGPDANWRAVEEAATRFAGTHLPHLILPIARAARVTQGEDGPLSHRGPWRHALDFECQDTAGRACPPGWESDLGAYASFGVPVHAPAAGTVLRVIDGVADNVPGGVNLAANWGNCIMIAMDQGGHVLLAHFRQHSICVSPGQRVEIATPLGSLGNSGRSPVPHLHMHVQATTEIGAPTIPFRIANYISLSAKGPIWSASGLPAHGDLVHPVLPDPACLAALAGMAPGVASYILRAEGERARAWLGAPTGGGTLRITLDEAGRHVFTDGRARLVAHAGPAAFRVLSMEGRPTVLLSCLFHGLATVPYARETGLTWADTLPNPAGSPFWPTRRRVLAMRFGAGTAVLVQAETEASPDFPVQALETTVAPVRGATAVRAELADGALVITQLSCEPGSPNGD
jgi:urea transporter